MKKSYLVRCIQLIRLQFSNIVLLFSFSKTKIIMLHSTKLTNELMCGLFSVSILIKYCNICRYLYKITSKLNYYYFLTFSFTWILTFISIDKTFYYYYYFFYHRLQFQHEVKHHVTHDLWLKNLIWLSFVSSNIRVSFQLRLNEV